MSLNNSLEEIRKLLEKEKSTLYSRLDDLSKQDPFSDPDRASDNAASDTEASEESIHDRVAALISEINKKITDIDIALNAIADGKYGLCQICGKRISPDRLRILPTATICIDCEKDRKSQKYRSN